MGKKNTNTHHEDHRENHNDNKSNDSKTKNNTIVFKVDLHCEGCANKLVKIIRSSEGVEGVKCELTASKISVMGDVDPMKLREKIEQRTNKKVELISPLPKKEKAEGNGDKKSKDNKDNDNKEKNDDNNKKSNDEKKPKELPVTTAVIKVHLHCEGCIQKIHKIVAKSKGYKEMKIDKQKDLVTVTGAMDMKSLAENLKKQLKRNAEIVPAKNDGEKKGKAGGNEKKGGGEKAANGGGGGMEGHKMQMHVPYGFPYPPPPQFNTFGPMFYGGEHVQQPHPPPQFHQVQYPYGSVHAPQMFSDENPNACSVM